MSRAMELISRALFILASVILMGLALALIGYNVWHLREVFTSDQPDIASGLLDAVGYVIVAIAVFDVAKYLLEEEVLRGRELRDAAEARRSLTKFISTIAIAVFLEALVLVFQVAKKQVSDMLYPTLLLVAGILLIVGLGMFQRLSVAAEQQKEQSGKDD